MSAIQHSDAPTRADRGNERGPVSCEESQHRRQPLRQDGAVLRTGQPFGRQNEGRHASGLERRELRSAMADRLVLRDDDPPALTRTMQPDLVVCVLGEVIGVGFDLSTSLPQRLRNGVAPEVSVDEEDGSGPLTRRRGSARSG